MILHFSNGRPAGTEDTSTLLEPICAPVITPPAERFRIRRYQPGDRRAIRHLCCETGFLGEPIEPLFHDRELFADLFTRPYLEHEPDWALVADVEGASGRLLAGSRIT